MVKKKKRYTNLTGLGAGLPNIRKIILQEAKQNKSIIYGARAQNAQTPGIIQRRTVDWDIYSKNPKRSAKRVERRLDREVAGQDDFYMKRARHKGTWKVMHEGFDHKQRTKDDIGIADYTKMPRKRPTTKSIGGIKYQTLGSISKDKRKILKDPESKYRHKKDKEDLMRISMERKFRQKR